ncbi:DEP domain-containing protein 7-like [Salarias fasciatus]|uniref:DEP domain-containing protein 7-like n=1 Tax=Salarias fasciatus TaxID=181472 RepID=UPI0011765949|nr:DEP domain-containing protein 7-like [Salarias fasciatus]
MSSIRERAAALHLEEKLSLRPHGVSPAPARPPHPASGWRSLLHRLRSSVTVKRRRLHLKSHSDCFLGNEAADVLQEHLRAETGASVSRDRVVCVCQVLLQCGVFEAVGNKVFGKEKKRDAFQDSRSALYRFVDGCSPAVEDLERGALENGIQNLFCGAAVDRWTAVLTFDLFHRFHTVPLHFNPTGWRTDPSGTPAGVRDSSLLFVPGSRSGCVPLVLTPSRRPLLCVPLSRSPRRRTRVRVPAERWPTRVSGSPFPVATATAPALSPSGAEEVWREQTLLRLLDLVELPLLDGLLHCVRNPPAPEPIHSGSQLDRQILRAFRDSQEDRWLRAALDCLDFLPDQLVVELSRELPHRFPGETPAGGQRSIPGPPGPPGGAPAPGPPPLDRWKLVLFRTLARHYGGAGRAALLPIGMKDVYSAVTQLLVEARLHPALEALQLCLKLLPSRRRVELHHLLAFMAVASDPDQVRLDQEVENRRVVQTCFSRAILDGKTLNQDQQDLLLVFMLSNVHDVFKIPGSLHKLVSVQLSGPEQRRKPLPLHQCRHMSDSLSPPGSTSCQQASTRTTTTTQELWSLLNNIHLDPHTSTRERKRLLRQFQQAHPQIFYEYFGDSARSVL